MNKVSAVAPCATEVFSGQSVYYIDVIIDSLLKMNSNFFNFAGITPHRKVLEFRGNIFCDSCFLKIFA